MAQLDPRFDPVFQRGYDPAQHGEPIPSSRREVDTLPEEIAPRFVSLQGEHVDDQPVAARNPWLLALLVVSLAMLAAAGLLLYQLATAPNSGVNGQDAVATIIQTLQYQATPALITAGFVGLGLRISLGLLVRRA